MRDYVCEKKNIIIFFALYINGTTTKFNLDMTHLDYL